MTWSYQYTPYIWLVLAPAMLSLLLSLAAWRQGALPGARPFAVLALILALWLGGAALELTATDIPAKIFWFRLQGVCLTPAVTAGLCFALSYAKLGRWLTRRTLALLAVPPVLFAVLILTNDLHHWIWLGFSYEGRLLPLRGPWNRPFLIYGYLLSLGTIVTWAWLIIRSPLHRWPAALCLAVLLISRIAYVVDAAGRNPVAPLSLATLSIVPFSTVYAIALFRLRIFDPLPAARATAVAQMREGMVICDAQWRVLSLNPAAESIFGAAATQARGRDVQEFLGAFSGLPPLDAEARVEPSEISRGEGTAARHYALDHQPLKGPGGLLIGHLLLLRDVTARRQAEAALRESEEKLRLIFEHASDGIAIYEEDPDRGERRLVDCNERYAEMSGRSKVELLEVGDPAKLQKPLPPVAYAKPRRELGAAQSVGFFSWVRPDGSENVIEYSAVSLRVRGRLLTIGLDRDMTEERRAQEQLLEQQRVLVRMQERELQVARQVQASLLPDHTPEVPGWGFAAFWRPARVVAGDFYDLFPVRLGPGVAQGWGVVIADVSDKGMPAALFMALSRSTLRSSVAQGLTPREALARANGLICADATSGMFVSLFYAQLDPNSGEMTYVNCGHNPPLLLRAGAGEFVELTRTGMVLGIEETAPYEQRRIQLGAGDLLVLYTDGLTEALDAQGEEYGLARLQHLILDHRLAPAGELAEALQGAVSAWAGGDSSVAPYDDVTVVVIKRS